MAGTIETTSEKIRRFRVDEFMKLGFELADAETLADSRQDNGFPIELGSARRLVRAGCSIDLAKRILL